MTSPNEQEEEHDRQHDPIPAEWLEVTLLHNCQERLDRNDRRDETDDETHRERVDVVGQRSVVLQEVQNACRRGKSKDLGEVRALG